MYNIAILGCGKVAHLHAKAVQQLTRARLAGVWSRTQSTAEAFARQYQTTHYTSVAELVVSEHIDLAIVCTPHPYHNEPAMEAMQNGAHVLVEKPLAVTLDDSDAMIDAAQSNNVRLGVISQRRWYAPSMRVKQAITEGKVGQPALGTVIMLGWRDKAYYDSDAWRGT